MERPDELEHKRLRELALRAAHGECVRFTRFLEPTLVADCRAAASEAGVALALWGGYEDAERRIAAFFREEPPEAAAYPLACLELRWNPRYASPGHRDLLGATMGLGLERDAVGDVALAEEDGVAFLFVHRDVASYALTNLESAGRAKLKARAFEGEPKLRAPEGVNLRLTVSSFRLDAILAAGLKLSRAEAQRLIEAGLVKRNHQELTRADVALREDDLLSVRGYGRLRIVGFDGCTRKGRQAIRLFRFTN